MTALVQRTRLVRLVGLVTVRRPRTTQQILFKIVHVSPHNDAAALTLYKRPVFKYVRSLRCFHICKAMKALTLYKRPVFTYVRSLRCRNTVLRYYSKVIRLT